MLEEDSRQIFIYLQIQRCKYLQNLSRGVRVAPASVNLQLLLSLPQTISLHASSVLIGIRIHTHDL